MRQSVHVSRNNNADGTGYGLTVTVSALSPSVNIWNNTGARPPPRTSANRTVAYLCNPWHLKSWQFVIANREITGDTVCVQMARCDWSGWVVFTRCVAGTERFAILYLVFALRWAAACCIHTALTHQHRVLGLSCGKEDGRLGPDVSAIKHIAWAPKFHYESSFSVVASHLTNTPSPTI